MLMLVRMRSLEPVGAACVPPASLLGAPTTSEHPAKKARGAAEPGLAHMDCAPGPMSHEQKLSQSLEMALSSTLGSMPSFTSRLSRGRPQHAGQPGSGPGPACAACKSLCSPYLQKEPVYQLSCGHLLCRPCLGEKQRAPPATCPACQRPIASQDVLRVHF
nr:unnamed protein product [Sorex araneus]